MTNNDIMDVWKNEFDEQIEQLKHFTGTPPIDNDEYLKILKKYDKHKKDELKYTSQMIWKNKQFTGNKRVNRGEYL